jgi:hypothetical protein
MQPAANRSLATVRWIIENDPVPVTALRDTVIDALGYDACGEYVETYWLAVLGPSCVLAARRLAVWLAAEPEGFTVPLPEFARSLGLGAGTARHAPVVRTLARLVDFDIARVGDSYALRTTFPPLTVRQVARLPEHLAAAHAVWSRAQAGRH